METRSTNPRNNVSFLLRLATVVAVILISLILSKPAHAQVPDTLLASGDSAGNVRMSLHRTGAFLLGGAYTGATGNIPIEGPGTRLMWYPEKAAFRAGLVHGPLWDDAFIGDYSLAIGEDNRAPASNSVALGLRCVAAQQSSFAMGEQSTASGAASVALGYHAHTNARQGSFVFADRATVDTLRAGVNHSANWRVSGGFRIFTSSNLSTGVTLQSGASVSNWGQSNAVISTSTGAMLTTGGVWQNASDVNRKHLFEVVSGEDILSRLRTIAIKKWTYKAEDSSIRHLGPTSQDFYATFGLGSDARSIGTVDADGVSLACIQALEERTRKLSAQLDVANEANRLLQKRLDLLEQKGQAPIMAGIPYFGVFALIGIVAIILGRKKRAGSVA